MQDMCIQIDNHAALEALDSYESVIDSPKCFQKHITPVKTQQMTCFSEFLDRFKLVKMNVYTCWLTKHQQQNSQNPRCFVAYPRGY